MLQHLALAQIAGRGREIPEGEETAGVVGQLPNLVLAIEEPELYQHPSRQRHLARILLQLATGATPGVADTTQVVYATHSPLFVGIDRVDQLRILRKTSGGTDLPKITTVARTSLDAVAKAIWEADGEKGEQFTGQTLAPRLQALMTPEVSEGFFANVATLVEGEDDRAAILGAARFLGYDFDSMGIAVVPCRGKTSLDRPAAIFLALGIASYLVWDSDSGEEGAKPEDNHRLLRLLGAEVTDWPSGVFDRYASFERNLETTLEKELGAEEYVSSLSKCQEEFRIAKKKDAIKCPAVITRLLERASEAGKRSPTLAAIVERIASLAPVPRTLRPVSQ